MEALRCLAFRMTQKHITLRISIQVIILTSVCLFTFSSFIDGMSRALFSKDNKVLITSAGDKHIKLTDVESKKLIHKFVGVHTGKNVLTPLINYWP